MVPGAHAPGYNLSALRAYLLAPGGCILTSRSAELTPEAFGPEHDPQNLYTPGREPPGNCRFEHDKVLAKTGRFGRIIAKCVSEGLPVPQ